MATKKPAPAPAASAPTIGMLIDQMHAKREEKRLVSKQLDELDEAYRALETQLLALMDAQKTTKGAGAVASASVSETVVANVEDWDKFHAYIHKMKAYHLLERRPAQAAVRELFQMSKTVPGVTPFTNRRINLRAAT